MGPGWQSGVDYFLLVEHAMFVCKDISQQGVLCLCPTALEALCLIANSPCAPESLGLKFMPSGVSFKAAMMLYCCVETHASESSLCLLSVRPAGLPAKRDAGCAISGTWFLKWHRWNVPSDQDLHSTARRPAHGHAEVRASRPSRHTQVRKAPDHRDIDSSSASTPLHYVYVPRAMLEGLMQYVVKHAKSPQNWQFRFTNGYI